MTLESINAITARIAALAAAVEALKGVQSDEAAAVLKLAVNALKAQLEV